MSLIEKHQERLGEAVKAIHERHFFAAYHEHPKAYPAEEKEKGKAAFEAQLNQPFKELLQTGELGFVGTESSPYTNQPLGISYPSFSVAHLINQSQAAFQTWKKVSVDERAALLMESLEGFRNRFFEVTYANHHTTGQSWGMSFQAGGPHAADRAMEALALAYHELNRFPSAVRWEKPMGKMNLQLNKSYQAIPKGVGLVIGCSTFPTWNTVPGLYASLMTGNTVIVKPHPQSIWPIAIVIAELQKVLQENGFDPNAVQLAVDTPEHLIAKELAEHPAVKLIDYTGGNAFGDYIESLSTKKSIFTEKSGVNSVIIDSVYDLREVMRNLAFSVSLYSGQMCTAPQNFFIPEGGIPLADGEHASYKEAVDLLQNEIASLALNPRMGAGVLGAIASLDTMARAKNANELGANNVLTAPVVKHHEFKGARIQAPTILEVDSSDKEVFRQELFGPVIVIVKTKDTEESVKIAKEMAQNKGAITCSLYSTDASKAAQITNEMNEAFVPVSLNLTGLAFVNQHAAFSDFHVTGGNPSGNASFTNPAYINNRFVWVGNRTMA